MCFNGHHLAFNCHAIGDGSSSNYLTNINLMVSFFLLLSYFTINYFNYIDGAYPQHYQSEARAP